MSKVTTGSLSTWVRSLLGLASQNPRVLEPGRARLYSLAAVGIEDPIEEFHAHNGEGIVEDEQGEGQAVGRTKGWRGLGVDGRAAEASQIP